jgi:hypothetical protein
MGPSDPSLSPDLLRLQSSFIFHRLNARVFRAGFTAFVPSPLAEVLKAVEQEIENLINEALLAPSKN